MGFDFNLRDTTGLAVQHPDWRTREANPQAYDNALSAYFDAPAELSGTWHSSFGWFGQNVLHALQHSGVLVDEPSGEWPAQTWVNPDPDSEDFTLTPEGEAFFSRMLPTPWKVPSFKFSSNDGWIVTPQECRWIAYALWQHPDAHVQAFARFCMEAAKHGGFTVD